MQNPEDGASLLFLSADLVGSTAFKQQDPKGWLATTLGFYQQFPSLVAKTFLLASDRSQTSTSSAPPTLELWKALGDELIFSCLITEESHAALGIRSFIEALREWASLEVTENKQLPLKGGAWVATFPLPDRAIAVTSDPSLFPSHLFDPDRTPEQNNRQLIKAIEDNLYPNSLWSDFVGPGVDLGFRLVQHASPRKFILSLEAAWLLAEADSDAELYFGGEVALRGFDHGGGYPLFWLDVAQQRKGDAILDEIQGVKPVTTSQVCDLASALCSGENWPTRLYLPSSNKPRLQNDREVVEREIARLNLIRDTQDEIPRLS